MDYTLDPKNVLLPKSKENFDPVEISYYSTDHNLKDHYEDECSLRYYIPYNQKGRNYNLSQGYKKFKPFVYDRNVPRHSSLLNALKFIECKHHKKIDVDIITNRGILLDMLYLVNRDCQKAFEFNLVKFDGQLFISETDYRDSEDRFAENHLKAMYAGYSFEQVVTTSKYGERTPYTPVRDNNASFKSVIKLGLDKHRILVRSENDCVIQPRELNDSLSNYLELKTHSYNAKNSRYYYAKLFKTYYQCKISGMDQFVIGFRNKYFQLIHTSKFKLEDIEISNQFNRGEDWLNYVLDWIKSTMEKEGGDYWKLTFDTHLKQLKLSKIEKQSVIDEMFQNAIGEDFKNHRMSKEYL